METRCVILDIGGVLEYTPDTGWQRRWEERLGLPAGTVDRRLDGIWQAGAVGAVSEDEVHRAVGAGLGLDGAGVEAFMGEMWAEYLGTPNEELIAYVGGLRPRCTLGILSNSMVGARERETALYRFDELVDLIVYSHETGIEKPDSRAYELTCARLGVTPEACVFLDDRAENVRAAELAGMRGVLFEDNASAMAAVTRHLDG